MCGRWSGSMLCRVCGGVSGGWTQVEYHFVGVGYARTRSKVISTKSARKGDDGRVREGG